MIPPHARHDSKLFAPFVGVLGIDARSGFLGHLAFALLQGFLSIEALVVIVVVDRCSHADVMLLCDICFKHQLGIAVLLGNIILSQSESVVAIVPRTVQHQGDRRVVVGIEGKSILPLHLIAVGLDRSSVERF